MSEELYQLEPRPVGYIYMKCPICRASQRFEITAEERRNKRIDFNCLCNNDVHISWVFRVDADFHRCDECLEQKSGLKAFVDNDNGNICIFCDECVVGMWNQNFSERYTPYIIGEYPNDTTN